MANFGELVLVLGDLHIPSRASKIPAPFKRMLVPNKMQHVICTGNVSKEDYAELQALAPNVHAVAGDYDDPEMMMMCPETRVISVGAFRVGVIHGHQIIPWHSKEAIERVQRKLNVDILVTGHTHQNQVSVQDDTYYHINPGSITGASSALCGDSEVIPSFILLAVQDTKVVCYVYELVKGEVQVRKTEFQKKKAPASSPFEASPANSVLMASLLS